MYDDAKDKPAPKDLDSFEPFDDFSLTPYDKEELYDHVDHQVRLDMKMDNLDDGAN